MNAYLETAISLILIFTIFSIIVYVVQEIIAVNLQYRGKIKILRYYPFNMHELQNNAFATGITAVNNFKTT